MAWIQGQAPLLPAVGCLSGHRTLSEPVYPPMNAMLQPRGVVMNIQRDSPAKGLRMSLAQGVCSEMAHYCCFHYSHIIYDEAGQGQVGNTKDI